jgi:hypothetical protein
VQRYTANPPALHVEDVFRIRPQVEGGQYDLSAYLTDVKRGRWFGRLDQYDDSSIIVLGSPATCHPCEHVLASMFGENPYSDAATPLPFRFVWSRELYSTVQSTFAMCAERNPKHSSTSGILGLQFGKDFLPIEEGPAEWDTYGVRVAQRRRSGQLWLVLAGATGTATYAGAELLDDMRTAISSAPPREDGPPVLFVVAARVRREGQRRGDNRVVMSQRVIAGPIECRKPS